jgi:hypothetical protein
VQSTVYGFCVVVFFQKKNQAFLKLCFRCRKNRDWDNSLIDLLDSLIEAFCICLYFICQVNNCKSQMNMIISIIALDKILISRTSTTAPLIEKTNNETRDM